MTSHGLGKRVDALEAVADDALEAIADRDATLRVPGTGRHALPEAHDLTPAELDAATAEAATCLERVAEWRRLGVSEREIVRRCAVECSMTVAEYDTEMGALRRARSAGDRHACGACRGARRGRA